MDIITFCGVVDPGSNPGAPTNEFQLLVVYRILISSKSANMNDNHAIKKIGVKKMVEKKNEEWIEKIVICPDCVEGRMQHWKEIKSVKPAWRYHIPCSTCNGQFETIVHQPKFCQIDDCSLPAEHKCEGYFCKGEGWVCETHWKQEDIGFSDTGYACISCWHEVGSGGH
tara:strand:- start:1175 stop:1681 length:507 start_codon:yes stop_codon:yes gene_type:complete